MSKETKGTPKTVEVEMTQEQKEQFVKWQLEQEKKVEEKKEDEALYQMTLSQKIRLGNREFGPGPAQIPSSLLGTVVWLEQKSANHELNLNSQNKRLVRILQSGQQIPVKVG